MTNLTSLSRREREIMEIIFSAREATVHQVCQRLDGNPTPMAVRRMLAILMEKGHLKRKKVGREFVYLAKQSKPRAGVKALRQVIDTFFEGSIGAALATHLERPGSRLTQADVKRLEQVIEDLKQKESDND
ncbi:Penicillinase repressor [Stieleria maiorica]|uniref:Penicillinase repressor n=1 Tax=Stieleria maiorica TaxID=2795974 RepID=A0A5B9MNG5_9BACT|nr:MULTISPECIES: BlaI/MecI/CopY family transcriptional regulator [Pirellulaceae]QEG02484.1 Penicillinase repressor [Stieleria maiorica]